jgi:hypothetical protein
MDSYLGLYKKGQSEPIGIVNERVAQNLVSKLNKTDKKLVQLFGIQRYYTLPLRQGDIDKIRASERPSLKGINSLLCGRK